jgi:hypothetical protein
MKALVGGAIQRRHRTRAMDKANAARRHRLTILVIFAGMLRTGIYPLQEKDEI